MVVPREWLEHVDRELIRLRRLHLLRETRRTDTEGVRVHFGSNDYLGLARRPRQHHLRHAHHAAQDHR